MKKRICILLSGQIRCNGLNPSYTADNVVLESVRTFLLNDKFKDKYNVDVFISSDCLDIKKAYDFFGEDNIKNICFYEKNYFLNEVKCQIRPLTYYEGEYSKMNFNGCKPYPNMLGMLYRLHIAYMLMKDYQTQTGVIYDYVIKLRPDSKLTKDIFPLFDILETTDTQIVTEHDHFTISKYDLSDTFDLIGKYGSYDEHCDKKKEEGIYSYLTRDGHYYPNNIMCYCPEKQYSDNVYFAIKSRNLEHDKAFKGIIYPTYTAIYRGNGKFAYM